MLLEASIDHHHHHLRSPLWFFKAFSSMDLMTTFLAALVLATLSAQSLILLAQPLPPSSRITVQGFVICDVCYANTFSKHGYFLPGAEVHIQCRFKANSPGTTEQITLSVNRTTNRHGMYKLDIPSVEGVDCVEDPYVQSFCQASLIGSSASACNLPGLKTTSDEITLKSKQNNQCIYGLSALSFRPRTRNITLCAKIKRT